jgi:electron transfer flavoprotein beta subunit
VNILVCIKQVLDPETNLVVGADGTWVEPTHAPRYQMNRFDEYAVELAVQLKEKHPGTHVDVITVGPESARTILERALGMGADNAFHILADDVPPLPPKNVAEWIAGHARTKQYDLILTGAMSEDLMQGQVGPVLASVLDYPWATAVLEANLSDGKVRVSRELEGGVRHNLVLTLPALLAVQSGINQPRYPTLSNLLRAKKQEVPIIDSNSLEASPSGVEITSATLPGQIRDGIMLEGDPAQSADKLVTILKDKALI